MTVTAVCPGPVPTEFQAANDAAFAEKLPKMVWVSAERVAQDALQGAAARGACRRARRSHRKRGVLREPLRASWAGACGLQAAHGEVAIAGSGPARPLPGCQRGRSTGLRIPRSGQ